MLEINAIGITHVFHALTFAGSGGCFLNMRPSVQTSSEGHGKC